MEKCKKIYLLYSVKVILLWKLASFFAFLLLYLFLKSLKKQNETKTNQNPPFSNSLFLQSFVSFCFVISFQSPVSLKSLGYRGFTHKTFSLCFLIVPYFILMNSVRLIYSVPHTHIFKYINLYVIK